MSDPAGGISLQEAANHRRKRARALATAARVLLGVAGLGYALWGLDLKGLAEAWDRYQMLGVLPAMLAGLLSYGTLGVRLAILTEGEPGVRSCAAAAVLGLGTNNIFPAKLGELAKVLYLHQVHAVSLGRGLSLVFWERVFDVIALLLLVLTTAAGALSMAVLAPLLAVAGGGTLVLFIMSRHPALVQRLVDLIPFERLRLLAGELSAHLGQPMSRWRTAAMTAATAAVWVLYALQALLVLYWVAHLPLSLGQALLVFTVSALGMALPSSPGSLGVHEAAVVAALGWLSVPKAEALMAALVTHAVQYIPTTLAAVLILTRTHLRLWPGNAPGGDL